MADDDFYSLSVGQVVHNHFSDVEVEYGFTNRNVEARIADELDVDELGLELERLEGQQYNRTELHYILGTDEYGQRMFSADFMEHLRNLRRPKFHLGVTNDRQLDLRFQASWGAGLPSEVPTLAAVSGLRTRHALRKMSRFERVNTLATAVSRLGQKV